MQLACPSCGCRASIEAWENDAEQRGFMSLLAEMPRPVAMHLLRYCGLFRSPQAARGMSWTKAHNKAKELADLVSKGYVQAKGKPARDCTPQHWGQGMDIMINLGSIGELELPIKNHNYLIKTVWGKAEKASAEAEAEPPRRSEQPPPIDDMGQFARDFISKFGKEALDRRSDGKD